VIVEVAAGARERLVVLPHVAGQRDVAEHDGGRRGPEHSLTLERGPGALGPARHAAGGLRHPGGGGPTRNHGRVEVLLIPELSAERIIVEHVHVIEALGRMVAGVFDQRMVGAFHVAEPPAAGRLDPLGLGLGDLRLRSTRHAARPGPGVAADEDRAPFVRSVEGQELDVLTACVGVEALARVGDVPAEVPERRLRRRRRRGGDLGEEHQHVVGRRECRQAAPARLYAGRELLDVERDRRLGIDGIQVQVMEARCRKHASLLSVLDRLHVAATRALIKSLGLDAHGHSAARHIGVSSRENACPGGWPCRATDTTRRGRSARA
jgi:hypothetical protein